MVQARPEGGLAGERFKLARRKAPSNRRFRGGWQDSSNVLGSLGVQVRVQATVPEVARCKVQAMVLPTAVSSGVVRGSSAVRFRRFCIHVARFKEGSAGSRWPGVFGAGPV